MGDGQTAAEWKAKGNASFQAGKFKEAVQHFTKAIELCPKDHLLYSNRSGAYASLKQYEQALEDGSKCVSLKPDWPKGYSRKGLAEFHLGKVKSSIETYKKGLALDPSNEGLKTALEQAEANNPDLFLQKTLTAQTALLMKTPKFAKYCQEDPSFIDKVTGTLQEIIKNPHNLQIAMGLTPDTRVKEALSALLGLGAEEEEREEERSEVKSKKEEEEKKCSVVKTPEEMEADSWKEKGNALYKAKKFEEALDAYDKAIQINPTDIAYLNNKAAVYLEMGDFDRCLAECQKALDMRYEVRADFAKVAKVYSRMAVCYRRMKDYTSCISMYEKSLCEDNCRATRAALAEAKRLKEKDEEEKYIDPALAEEHRLKGNELFKSGAFPEAKKEYDEAIRRNPTGDPKLYTNRAAAFMKLFEYPSALKDVEKCVELDPTFVKAWSRKGKIHMLMKDYNKSINAYQMGLKVDAENAECRQGLEETLSRIHQNTGSDAVDEDQVKQAMSDPEIQAILSDPQFRLILNRISTDPSQLKDVLKDQKVATGLQKLMAAGILKIGS